MESDLRDRHLVGWLCELTLLQAHWHLGAFGRWAATQHRARPLFAIRQVEAFLADGGIDALAGSKRLCRYWSAAIWYLLDPV